MARITLQTIADELGVSRTTVSNAFSRPDQLSDELRERIMETATRLGYSGPDPAARRLRRGEAGVVGVVLKESLEYALSDPYAVRFLAGLATPVEAAGKGLLLIPCPPGERQLTGVKHAVVDGFAVFSLPDSHPVVAAVVERRLPTVFVDGPRLDGMGFVGIDDRQAMGELARLVLQQGHDQVAILTFRIAPDGRVGPADTRRLESVEYRVTRERLGGAVDAVQRTGLDPHVWEVGLNARAGARQAARRLLSEKSRPTAVICLSDEIALGVLTAAEELGIAVPGDLVVTGFDDIPEAGPAGLTTVRQPAARKGETAWRLLDREDVSQELLPYQLVVRSSTPTVDHVNRE